MLIILIIALILTVFAVINDLKTLEVPDWISATGIIIGLSYHTILSINQLSWYPLGQSLLGLLIAFIFGSLMYFTGQWGGGDTKLLWAMGAMIGADTINGIGSKGLWYLIAVMFCGAIWGLLYLSYLTIKNWKKVREEYVKEYLKFKKYSYSFIALSAIILVIGFLFEYLTIIFVPLALTVPICFYLTVLVKAVERICMKKEVTPDKLVEGDWIVKPIKVGNKTIKQPKTGLTKKQIREIQEMHEKGKIKKVLVKYGIPFTPAFLFAIILIIIAQSPLTMFL